jgi:hypothetical protein
MSDNCKSCNNVISHVKYNANKGYCERCLYDKFKLPVKKPTKTEIRGANMFFKEWQELGLSEDMIIRWNMEEKDD